MIFNCTVDRPGGSFLEAMVKGVTERLEFHKSDEMSSAFFDTVIFCTNITYADGHSKRGPPFLLLSSTTSP